MSDSNLSGVASKYLPFWNKKSRARCIKDNPQMTGFGKSMEVGDEVVVNGVIFDGMYKLAVPSERAFYEMEDYWEVML